MIDLFYNSNQLKSVTCKSESKMYLHFCIFYFYVVNGNLNFNLLQFTAFHASFTFFNVVSKLKRDLQNKNINNGLLKHWNEHLLNEHILLSHFLSLPRAQRNKHHSPWVHTWERYTALTNYTPFRQYGSHLEFYCFKWPPCPQKGLLKYLSGP